jgi:Asp-tRNA(Asn)/Glu-tRNA(Gln) amidotransferase A subunit family amidase
MISAKASPLQSLRAALASGEMTPRNVTEQVLGKINSNAGRNVYLALDGQRALHEAELLPSRFSSTPRPPLYGVPVSLKDCFDLAGFPTSCGSRFYATQSGFAREDSAVAAALLGQGALIVGKTHLNQLAYGITGENPDYGDCVQPGDATWLTGGSSSGAAASVQEGSAIAAIGTDTGGSVRVPAALCGLAGYRASIDLAYQNGLAYGRGLWRGGMHLAPSFDTLGWLFRDLRDGPVLAEALFGLQIPCTVETRVRIGCVTAEFLRDCQPAVMEGFRQWQQQLCECGAHIVTIDTGFWDEAMDIFAPLQAHEAAAIHQRNTGSDFSCFERSIAERLRWGSSIPKKELERLRQLHADFRDRMDALLCDFDFLIVPCAPINRLAAGGDHSQTRGTMLRYTTPMSLAGVPVIALPAENGAGVQLVAGRGADARLLAYSARASINPPPSN